MPRSSTARSKRNATGNSNTTSTSRSGNNADSKTFTVSEKKNSVKRECVFTTEQVFHRKSERRRVARDIFLVFEEQPNRRRPRGSHKKQSKPKFGHLKVEEPIKPKCLLRDIKNEPQCFLGKAFMNELQDSSVADKNLFNGGSKSHFKVWSSTTFAHSTAYKKNLDLPKVAQEISTSAPSGEFQIARVNPIFLWVKQDNTRIIEVRCEDYDKRNRIRITKTSNGWRAIPRSDPSSSKILKLYTSPLIKVKRENHTHELNNNISPTVGNVSIENKPVMVTAEIVDNISNSKETGVQRNGIDTVKSMKTKKNKSKKRRSVFSCKKARFKIHLENRDPSNFITENKCPADLCPDNEALPTHTTDTHNIYSEKCILVNINEHHQPSIKMSADQLYESSYQPEVEDENSLQLCPKTGFLFRKIGDDVEQEKTIDEIDECNNINSSIILDRLKNVIIDSKHNSTEDNVETLEAKTRNLKDLLDDADLFQHCDDNANSDADLIDTLVKSSCENNLSQDNDGSVKNALNQIIDKNLDGSMQSNLTQLIPEVSEPPKSLSFNEAGEIEVLNCELFQPREFADTFEQQASIAMSDLQVSTRKAISLQSSAADENFSVSTDKDDRGFNIIQDIPKDLSYKKREEVCPPSESRSQCAVTSSSDIVKSPNINFDETSDLTSSSETLKTLILEQFIKMNAISNLQNGSIELKKQVEITNPDSIYSKCKDPSNVIETVVIDDEDSVIGEDSIHVEDEPLNKRHCSDDLNTQINVEDKFKAKTKINLIDKDPDPLTQLRLLVQNSQWKVPDPILVPKERLSAVLASPAREIPLLITTRPELRLPEAFAYPEIIQNPNILVISMAQLEAILENDLKVEQAKSDDPEMKATEAPISKQNVGRYYVYDMQNSNCNQSKQISGATSKVLTQENLSTSTPLNKLYMSKQKGSKCSQIDSNLPDINAATMAVLNQMLWLPYFGKISQDFIKSLKTHNILQKVDSSLVSSKVDRANNLEDISDRSKWMSANIASDKTALSGVCTNLNTPTAFKQRSTDDLMFFQKFLHHRMRNINSSQMNNSAAELSTSEFDTKHCSAEESLQFEAMDHNRLNTGALNFSKNHKNYHNVTGASENIYNLRSSVARPSSPHLNMKSPQLNSKPRLTCRSLSNLLDPDHNQSQGLGIQTPTFPRSNMNFNSPKGLNIVKNQVTNKHPDRINCVDDGLASKLIDNFSNTSSLETTYNHNKKNENETLVSENVLRNTEQSTESNVPLWHPLFGSNSKSAYSSPWQWTTVTATGE